MRQNCKKILFSIITGILVLSLSLFALVGCGIMKSTTSSPSNDNTTIDNGANQTGNKGNATAQQTDKTDASNPSADTSNNENTHSTIGGGETNATQPDNGNGGDTDPNNNPNEDNIGGTDNPDTGVQSGTDNPNGNSGENNEGNGENGNTPNSGNENSDENGNGGNTSDDPTPDDSQPEELDFSGLEAKLEEVIREKHWGIISENIIAYGLSEGTLNVVYEVKSDVGAGIALGKIENIGELEDQEDINSAVNSRITKKSFKTQSLIGKASSDIIVDGVTYSKDGIEGDNPFARQCGVENAWMTYVSDFKGQTFYSFSTGYGKKVSTLVIHEDLLGNYNITVCEFVVESSNELNNNDLYKNFIQENKQEILNREEFNIGKNLKTSQVAEAGDLVLFNE